MDTLGLKTSLPLKQVDHSRTVPKECIKDICTREVDQSGKWD